MGDCAAVHVHDQDQRSVERVASGSSPFPAPSVSLMDFIRMPCYLSPGFRGGVGWFRGAPLEVIALAPDLFH